MKTRSLAMGAALAASLIGLSPVGVAAAPPEGLVINAHPCVFAPVETGPWEAEGAISDHGTFVRTGAAVSPPNAGFLNVRTAREEFLFTGTEGTFTVNAQESSVGDQTRVWEIGAGTGAYAATSGHGTAAFFITEEPNACTEGFRNFTFALTGVASKVGQAS